MPKSRCAVALAGLVMAMAAASWLAAAGFAALTRLHDGRWPSLASLAINPFEMDLLPAMVLPVFLALSIELLAIGWSRSSLRRIFVGGSLSSLNDIAYVALYLTGIGRILGIVGLLGAGLWLERHVSASMGLSVATSWPLWLAVPALYVWGSFCGYWQHRFEHSRWMWGLHVSHHSAEEFNVVNVAREHPFEWALNDVVNLLVPASLGFSPEAIAVASVPFLIQSTLLHSNWTELSWLEKLGFVTPAGHRLHHGVEARFHDHNFGEVLNVWDRLFGTYMAPGPDIDALRIGVEALAGRHNTLNPFREIALQTLDWLRTLRRELEASRQHGAEAALPRP